MIAGIKRAVVVEPVARRACTRLPFLSVSRVILSCVFVLAWDSNVVAAELPRFEVSGLRLGMPLDTFRRDRRNAKIVRKVPIRYCFGHPVALVPLTRFGVTVVRGGSVLEVKFGRATGLDRITSIRFKRIFAMPHSRIAQFRDRLARRHGPPGTTLVPKKMEPSGLIVGFEWLQPSEEILRLTLHRDRALDPDRVYFTTFLTNALPGLRAAQRASRHYRRTIQAFRERCRARGESRLPFAPAHANPSAVSQDGRQEEAHHGRSDP